MGGEKHLSGTTDNRPQGSPPRGRGKGYTGQALDSGVRITPAQAGKSPGSASGWPRRRDHPRAGGEKLMGRPRRSVGAGSPPRRRGKDSSGEPANGSIRITPAQAGKSPGSASGWPRRRDHPRAGGEKLMGRPRRSVGAGSPPRRRGKDSSGEPANGSIRITPAQAGKR